jgi:hypothetical protein
MVRERQGEREAGGERKFGRGRRVVNASTTTTTPSLSVPGTVYQSISLLPSVYLL